jgi:hypothetical protein
MRSACDANPCMQGRLTDQLFFLDACEGERSSEEAFTHPFSHPFRFRGTLDIDRRRH